MGFVRASLRLQPPWGTSPGKMLRLLLKEQRHLRSQPDTCAGKLSILPIFEVSQPSFRRMPKLWVNGSTAGLG